MNQPLQCLAPVIGIFAGVLVGWFLHFVVGPSPITDFAVRLFEVIFGIVGWAFTTILISQKKLHCGGTQRLDQATRSRYVVWGIMLLTLIVLAPVLLITRMWFLYFPCMGVLTFCFVGEIISGSPTKAFTYLSDY
jgi:hypothetical protein